MSEKGIAYRKVGSFLQSITLVAGDPYVSSHSTCMHCMWQVILHSSVQCCVCSAQAWACTKNFCLSIISELQAMCILMPVPIALQHFRVAG